MKHGFVSHSGAFVLIILLAGLAQAGDPSPVQAKRLAYLRGMEAKGAIRQANCKEIASAILQENGLPGIGKESAVQGMRGNVDRGGDDSAFPILRDELLLSKPDVVIQIRTYQDQARAQWVLILNREIPITRDQLNVQTAFYFAMDASKTLKCPLEKIDFAANAKKLGFHEAATYKAEDCIDLLDGDSPALQSHSSALSKMSLSVTEKDCTTGIHYFDEVKKILVRANTR